MGEKCASRSRFDVSFVSLDTHPPKPTTTRTQALSSLNTASTPFCYRRRRSMRSNVCITRPNLIQFPLKKNCPSPLSIYVTSGSITSLPYHFILKVRGEPFGCKRQHVRAWQIIGPILYDYPRRQGRWFRQSKPPLHFPTHPFLFVVLFFSSPLIRLHPPFRQCVTIVHTFFGCRAIGILNPAACNPFFLMYNALHRCHHHRHHNIS